MITVTEYCNFLKEAEENIEDIDRRIAYRKIELIGARANRTPFERNIPITDEEQRILENDSRLAQLMYDKQEYVNRIEFVRTRAEYPEIRE